MNKEYREMTPEERLRVINAVLNKDGFVELKKILDEYEKQLTKTEEPIVGVTDKNVHITVKNVEPIRGFINKEGLAGFAGISHDSDNLNLEKGSIYAPEHREEAMTENEIDSETEVVELEQPKMKILERENSTPNPWGDAQVVTPGQLIYK